MSLDVVYTVCEVHTAYKLYEFEAILHSTTINSRALVNKRAYRRHSRATELHTQGRSTACTAGSGSRAASRAVEMASAPNEDTGRAVPMQIAWQSCASIVTAGQAAGHRSAFGQSRQALFAAK